MFHLSNKQVYWFIIISSIIAFFPVFNSDFVYYDDPEYVINNPYIREFSWDNIKSIFAGKATILYVPLTTFTYLIEYKLFGLNPTGYHTVNLLFHICNSILLFKILSLLGIKNNLIKAVSIVVFTCHPLISESVCWITERKDVLYSFFYFLAAINFLKFYKNIFAKNYMLTILFFILACFSKPMAVNLPVLMLIYILYNDKKLELRKFIHLLPFILISALFSYISIVSIRNGATGKINITSYSMTEKLFLFVSEIGYYFFRPFYPANHKVFHLFVPKEDFFSNKLILFYFVLACILFLVLLYKFIIKKDTLILFLTVSWLIILLPVLQIYPNTHSYVSERYFYVSIIFPFIIVTGFLKSAVGTSNITAYKYVFGLSLLFVVLTYFRSSDWRNTEALMSCELKKDPKNAMALNNLGYYYNEKGNFKLALENLKVAVAFDSTNSFYLNNYGWALGGLGKLDSAIFYFKKASEHKKNYFDAINNLAVCYSMKEEYVAAKTYFEMGERINPNHPELLYNLGAYFLKQGDSMKAKQYFSKALEKGNKKAKKYLNN